MTLATGIRNSVTTLIDKLGSALTIKSYTGTTYDKWGDETLGSESTIVIQAIPVKDITNNTIQRLAGEYDEADFVLIIKAGDTVTRDDRVNFGGQDYNVVQIKEIPLQDVNIATRLELELVAS